MNGTKENAKERERKLIRKLFISTWPIQAVAMGLPALNDLINSFIIGSIMGTSATAAIGFAGPFTLFLSAVGSMMSGGSQLVCSRKLGNGDKQGLREAYTTTLVVCAAWCVLLTLITQLFPQAIAKLVGTSAESMEMTSAYIRGVGTGTFSIFVACLIPFLQLDHAGIICTITVIAQLVVNVAGTLVSALALNGELYMVGLSIAAANLVSSIIALVYLQSKSELLKFNIKNFDAGIIKGMLYSGIPGGLNPFLAMIRDIIMNGVFYAVGGTVALSAKTIAMNISTGVSSFVEGGYTGSARIIAGILVGERDCSSLRDLPKTMIEIGWYIYWGAFALVFIAARPMASLFVSNPEEIELYVGVIRASQLWFLTNAVKGVTFGIYQAMDKVKLISILNVFNIVVIPAGMAYIFGKQIGAVWMSSAYFVAEVIIIIALFVIFIVKARRFPRSIFEFTYIPSSIAVARENRFKATVSTVEEACEASQNAMDFCRGRGIDVKRSYYCGLSLEEILTFIIKSRFTNKDNTIDVRIMYENGQTSILIRDNCEKFDILQWTNLCEPEEAEKSLGIRMVKKFSSDMNYMSTMGLNVLTIKI